MKEHIIRAILYEDMSVKWKDEKQLRGSVNVHLNVHQKARQFVEAELGDFLLSDGEAILASFEKSDDRDGYHINPTRMGKAENEKGVFRLPIPSLVHNTPGVWIVQFSLVTDYKPCTGEYEAAFPFDEVKFSEHSSIIDDGLTVPTGENFIATLNEIDAAKTEIIEHKTASINAASSAQTAEANATAAANAAAASATKALEEAKKIENALREKVSVSVESDTLIFKK